MNHPLRSSGNPHGCWVSPVSPYVIEGRAEPIRRIPPTSPATQGLGGRPPAFQAHTFFHFIKSAKNSWQSMKEVCVAEPWNAGGFAPQALSAHRHRRDSPSPPPTTQTITMQAQDLQAPVCLPTIEGHEIQLAPEDHAKLLALPNVDLGRLVVIDDSVFASRRDNGEPHRLDLEAMLQAAQAAPAVPKNPTAVLIAAGYAVAAEGVVKVAPEVTKRPKARRSKVPAVPVRPKKPEAVVPAAPTTGAPRGLLADFESGKGDRRPRIEINGERQPCPMPVIAGNVVEVPLADRGRLAGYVRMDRDAYELLGTAPHCPDTWLFNVIDGRVTTRVRMGFNGPYVQPLEYLLAELGSRAPLTVVKQTGVTSIRNP